MINREYRIMSGIDLWNKLMVVEFRHGDDNEMNVVKNTVTDKLNN